MRSLQYGFWLPSYLTKAVQVLLEFSAEDRRNKRSTLLQLVLLDTWRLKTHDKANIILSFGLYAWKFHTYIENKRHNLWYLQFIWNVP